MLLTKKVFTFFSCIGKKSIFIASFLLFLQFATASEESMRYVSIDSCSKEFCVQLKTQLLYKSALGQMFAFGPSALKIKFDGKIVKNDFTDYEGAFDPRDKRFFLSKKEDSIEYMIDVIEQKVVAYKKSN